MATKASLSQAQRLLNAGEHAAAMRIISRYLAQYPSDPSALQVFGNALYRTAEYDAAEAAFRKLIRLTPTSALGHYSLGMVLNRRGELTEAANEFAAAAQLDPAMARASQRLRQLQANQLNTSQVARNPLSHSPPPPVKPKANVDNDAGHALQSQGNELYRKGDDAGAEAIFRRIIATNPQDGLAHYSLGMVLKRTNRFDEATISFEMALRVDPSLTRAADRLRELERQRARDDPSVKRKSSAQPTGAEDEEDEEHLSAGDLLGEGTRRIGSYLGRYALAIVLIAAGLSISAVYTTGDLRWFAEREPFQWPSIGFLRGRWEQTRLPEHGEVLARAIARVDAWSNRLDAIARFGSFAIAILGIALIFHSLLAARLTRYLVFQRRLDVTIGVLNRRRQSAWLYEIIDVELRQTPALTLTRNAEIRVHLPNTEYKKVPLRKNRSVLRIIGFGSFRNQENLWNEIRDAALKERRVMRRWYL